MWIILEGVDGSGKSTLQNAIIDRIRPDSVKIGHLGPPKAPDTAIDECLTGGIDESDTDHTYAPGKWHLISDRLHMGCPVYGPLYRPDADVDGYGDFGKAGWRYVELFLASRGAVTFLVQPTADEAIKRVLHRNSENHFSVDAIVEQLPTLIDRYDWLAADTMTLGAVIRSHSLDEVGTWADRMLHIASDQEAEALPLAEFPDYVGPTRPTTLIVCQPLRDVRLDAVAAMSDDAWHTVGFCSAGHYERELQKLHSVLREPAVIGLGDLGHSPANSFVWNCSGTFANDAADLAALL